MKKFSFLAITIILLMLTSQASAAVRAWVNQSTVYIGDPVTLTIEADDQSAPRPDLSVLEKDFRILGTGTGTRVSIVNGRSSATKSWTITLAPRGQGKITIPAITVGNDRTNPMSVTITDIPEAVKAQLRDHVTLESSIDLPDTPVYVQQQLGYTIKLFTDDAITSGELVAPQIDNAVVEQIAADKRYQAIRNGKKFNVIERRYVISPERSGKLHIPPAQFHGKMKRPTQKQPRQRARSPFDDFFNDDFFHDPFSDDFFSGTPFGDRGQPVQTSSKAHDIEVLPVPDSYHGKHWLPAEEVRIQDSWKTLPPEFKVGEPVVRSLQFQVRGVSGSQIPLLDIPAPEGIKVYPDQPKTDTLTDEEMVYGISEQSITYIPDRAGKTTIPEIRIDWWNTRTGKQETTTLPAIHVEVKPGQGGKTRTGATPAPSPQQGEADTPEAPSAVQQAKQRGMWQYLALLAALVLAGLGWRWISQRNNTTTPPGKVRQPRHIEPRKPPAVDQQAARLALKRACETGDAKTAAEQLLKLAAAQWPDAPPKNLGAIADQLREGAEAIRDLDRHLYGSAASEWRGDALWAAVKDGFRLHARHAQPHRNGIETLYPDRGNDQLK